MTSVWRGCSLTLVLFLPLFSDAHRPLVCQVCEAESCRPIGPIFPRSCPYEANYCYRLVESTSGIVFSAGCAVHHDCEDVLGQSANRDDHDKEGDVGDHLHYHNYHHNPHHPHHSRPTLEPPRCLTCETDNCNSPSYDDTSYYYSGGGAPFRIHDGFGLRLVNAGRRSTTIRHGSWLGVVATIPPLFALSLLFM